MLYRLRLYILWAQTVTTAWAQTVTTAWAQSVAQTVQPQTVTVWAHTVRWGFKKQSGLRLYIMWAQTVHHVGSDCNYSMGSDCNYSVGSDCDYSIGSHCDYSVGSDCTAWAQTVQRGLRLLQSEPTLYSLSSDVGLRLWLQRGLRLWLLGSDCDYSMGSDCTAWAQTVQWGHRLLQSEPMLYNTVWAQMLWYKYEKVR